MSLETGQTGTWQYLTGGLAYSPDGSQIAVAEVGEKVHIYDTSSGALRQFVGGAGVMRGILDLAYSPDSRWLAVGQQSDDDTREVIIWNTATWQEVTALPGHHRGVRGVGFSPQGDFLLTVAGDQILRQWNTKDWSLRRIFRGHTGPLQTLAIHPSGQFALTGGNDARLLAWDLTNPHPQSATVVLPHLQTFAFSPSGAFLAGIETGTDLSDVHRVVLRNAPDFRVQVELPSLGADVIEAAFSADGRTLASLSVDTVRLWDMERNQSVGQGTLPPSDTRCIAGFTADGRQLLLVDQELNILAWSVATRVIEDRWVVPSSETLPRWIDQRRVAFHPDSSTLILGARGRAVVWDTERRRRRGTLGEPGIWDVECAVSADGRFFATLGAGSAQSGVVVWDAQRLTRLSSMQTPPHPVSAISLSPDGRRVAVGHCRFASVGIYDTQTGIQILTIPAGPTMVGQCEWSPDGTVLVAVGDGGGMIWRTSTMSTAHLAPRHSASSNPSQRNLGNRKL